VAEDFALPAATARPASGSPLPLLATIGSRAFSVAGPQVWNCLQLEATLIDIEILLPTENISASPKMFTCAH